MVFYHINELEPDVFNRTTACGLHEAYAAFILALTCHLQSQTMMHGNFFLIQSMRAQPTFSSCTTHAHPIVDKDIHAYEGKSHKLLL